MAGWWRRYLDWRQRHVARIGLMSDGFTILARRERVAIPWAAIDSVTAYKRDLYTVDQLCLEIRAGDVQVELTEDMDGFAGFNDALHEALHMSAAWKLLVLFPAFEANIREIFVRDGSDAMASPCP